LEEGDGHGRKGMQTADARGRLHPAAEYNYQVVIRIGGRAGDVYPRRGPAAFTACLATFRPYSSS